MNGSFFICGNKSLMSLKYGPERVMRSYICSSCNLITLYGAPKFVGDLFDCSYNNLNSLKYSPIRIDGDMLFKYNNIKSFEHFPEYVGGDVRCEYTPIYNIWKLFEDKKYIERFNQMKIITSENKIDIEKLNLFLKSIGKEPVEIVIGYDNV